MINWGKKLPTYLVGDYQLTATVIFTALFAVLFTVLCAPFHQDFAWFAIGATKGLGFTAIFFLIVLILVSISKRTMCVTGRRRALTYVEYIIWNILEIVVISALYTFFTMEGEKLGIIDSFGEAPISMFIRAMEQCIIIIGVPYLISGMYFALMDKNNTIRLMNYSTVVSDEIVVPKDEKKITLFDNSGALKLSIRSSSLFYIESDDNYIIVWYTDGQDMLKKYMLRCRLKTIEESFADSSLVRCHRKYIVNTEKIKVLRKEKDGYILELENESIPPISISKTYEEKILSIIHQFPAD